MKVPLQLSVGRDTANFYNNIELKATLSSDICSYVVH